jgi:hypothetical protein
MAENRSLLLLIYRYMLCSMLCSLFNLLSRPCERGTSLVIASPSPVILSEAKNLGLLRINSAISPFTMIEKKRLPHRENRPSQ